MTKRLIMAVLFAAVLLACALSTRGTLFWALFWVLGMMVLLGLISVLWTRMTLTLDFAIDREQVTRGEEVTLHIDVRHKCPLPVAALRLDISALSGRESFSIHAPVRPFVKNPLHYTLLCPHVGAFASGVSAARVRDVFGLFSTQKKFTARQDALVVLPQVYMINALTFSPGDSDVESRAVRAFEDATMPTDLRAFQQGDELKKVHWKLSMRRKELLVKVYEQPQRPDALLLVDCAPPDVPQERMAVVRDAICEAAASLAAAALTESAPVRMPLLTEQPVDVSASKPEDIGMVRDALARCRFDAAEQFERVLMLETRRMRRTGATGVVTSKLNPELSDMILRIRRMGPKVRVLLAADPQEEMTALMITRLMRNDVEVETIEV